MTTENQSASQGQQSGLFARLVAARLASDQHSVAGTKADWDQFPVIMQFLTRTDAGQEHSKEPASIVIKNVCGTFQVEITDPSLEVAILSSSPSLSDAMASLEAVLGQPNVPIRSWRGAKGKLVKKNAKAT